MRRGDDRGQRLTAADWPDTAQPASQRIHSRSHQRSHSSTLIQSWYWIHRAFDDQFDYYNSLLYSWKIQVAQLWTSHSSDRLKCSAWPDLYTTMCASDMLS